MTRVVLGASVLCVLQSVTVLGQPSQSVAGVLEFLVTNQSITTGSVERDRQAAQATSDTISRALLANLATLPVTSSSGAFAYRLNPELGTVERTTQSFGPFFVERAVTAGSRTGSLALTYQHLRFVSLDGRHLRDGSLVTTANKFVDESEPFDVDQLTLDIDADVATLYGNLGIGNRVDVGFAAPLVMLTLGGARANTYRGRSFMQASATATAVGLADAVVRTKVALIEDSGLALAAAVDARLPTGRRDNLLGAGRASMRFSAIGSVDGRRVSGHANLGLGVGGLARELSYGAAIAASATPRLTLTGEVLGRVIDGAGHIVSESARHPTLADVEVIRLASSGGNLHTIAAAPGIKWNVADTWVLVANVSIPLTQGGLTSPITPFVGIDYTIGR